MLARDNEIVFGRERAAQSRPRLHGVYSLREGKIVRMDEHSVRAQALEAAGLSE